jgi:hypothetical protein
MYAARGAPTVRRMSDSAAVSTQQRLDRIGGLRDVWQAAHEKLAELVPVLHTLPRLRDLDPDYTGTSREEAEALLDEVRRHYEAYLGAVRFEVALGA